MLLTALAVDPGPTRSGVAVVSFDGRRFMLLHGRHLHFCGGVHAAGAREPLFGRDELAFLMRDVAEAGGLVAVESIVGWAYEAKRVQALVETGRTEGRIIDLANSCGIEPVLLPEREVRGVLCRSESAGDKAVAAVVEALVFGVGRFRATEREHIYDATATGMVALARAAGMAIPRTTESERALMMALAEEKADRAARRARKVAGDAAPARGMTRAQRARRRAGAKKGWERRAAHGNE